MEGEERLLRKYSEANDTFLVRTSAAFGDLGVVGAAAGKGVRCLTCQSHGSHGKHARIILEDQGSGESSQPMECTKGVTVFPSDSCLFESQLEISIQCSPYVDVHNITCPFNNVSFSFKVLSKLAIS